ncbi:hypothetical protein BST81_17865 [Leptolyngbya sp. 'hensonii']|uniref:hypothetical protein n=1 Tax=Leptolyngbya sp. 'hensonii' TaxID=1922337 RepID=UPI00094F8EEB|nr:hypothetical protein [Leptolyngbya sp. 'hensonii']OLP17214.1 hypothetical protein BST81_17865 [Leptolyngbya sp. 'hensonii']
MNFIARLMALLIASLLSMDLIHAGFGKFFAIQAGAEQSISLDAATRLRISLFYLALNLIYLLWIWNGRQHRRSQPALLPDGKTDSPESVASGSFTACLSMALPFLILAVAIYPIGSDIYLYLHYGLMASQGINPFMVSASSFMSEFSPFLRWEQTSTYGPLAIGVFALAAGLTKISPLLAIYSLKGFCLMFHLLNAFLIWQLLASSPLRSAVTTAYLLHPLLLFEQISIAHIDVLMATTLLGFMLCFKQGRYTAGLLLLWLGFLTKTLPILWFPLATVFLMRKGQWRSLLTGMLLIVAAIGALQKTILPTAEEWTSLLNPGVSGKSMNSLYALLNWTLNGGGSITATTRLWILSGFSLSMLILVGIYAVIALWKIGFKPEGFESEVFLEIGWTTLLLLLLATPWLMPWYSSILLPIAAVCMTACRFTVMALTFCFAASCCYTLLSWTAVQSAVATGIPLLVLLFLLLAPAVGIIELRLTEKL